MEETTTEKNIPVLEYDFLDRDGVKIEYEVSGNKDGDVLVMLNGNGGDYHVCDDSIYPRMAEFFKIVRFSTRGTGKSARGSEKLTFELFSDDLKALLDHLGIAKANVFGFSDGGNLGLVFTVEHPRYVKRLAVMGANLNTMGTKTNNQLGIHRDFRKYAIKAKLQHSEEFALRRDIEGLMVGQPHLNYKKISNIDVPFLNIYGEFDMFKRRHSRRITRAVPGAEEIMVLNKGHGSSFDKHDFLLEPVLLHFFGVQ